MSRGSWRRIWWVTIFGIAMGYFEASVVVYLRAIIYPGGFSFPLQGFRPDLLFVELGREAMSIGMLVAVGALAGRNIFEKFTYFCFAFGVWDILYYVFLKIAIGWPASIFTWDILFLLPVPWVGPVWAPVLISLCFIGCGLLIVRGEDKGKPIRPSAVEWAMAILGGLIVIISFCKDYGNIIKGGVPTIFTWEIYLIGLALGLASFIRAYQRANRSKTSAPRKSLPKSE